MTRRNDIDRLLATEMDGRDKLTAALKARGFTLSGFARHIRHWPEEVRMTVRGLRPYPDIRDAFAKELDLTREEIDELIDGPKAPAADEGDALSRQRVPVPA